MEENRDQESKLVALEEFVAVCVGVTPPLQTERPSTSSPSMQNDAPASRDVPDFASKTDSSWFHILTRKVTLLLHTKGSNSLEVKLNVSDNPQ